VKAVKTRVASPIRAEHHACSKLQNRLDETNWLQLRRLLLKLGFFVYSRDAAGTAELRDDQELLEQHWSYIDRFAEWMIARGPTLDTNRETVTPSLHVLALPGADAVRQR
jgi:hypothetical protein